MFVHCIDISGGHLVPGFELGFEKTKVAGTLHVLPGSLQFGSGRAAPLSAQTEHTGTIEAAVLSVWGQPPFCP